MPIKISIVGSETLANLPFFTNGKTVIELADRFAFGEEAVRYIPNRNIDIALVNYELPCMDGFECVRKLKALLPDLPIFMFTTGEPTRSKDDDLIFSALHAETNGYLPGHLPPAEIANAVVQVHNAACRNRHLFLMFFESDRQLGQSAKHWKKIAALLNSSTATIHYGKNWRKIVLQVRKTTRKSAIHPLVPLITIHGRAVATV